MTRNLGYTVSAPLAHGPKTWLHESQAELIRQLLRLSIGIYLCGECVQVLHLEAGLN